MHIMSNTKYHKWISYLALELAPPNLVEVKGVRKKDALLRKK